MGGNPRSRRSQRTACSEIRPKPTRDHGLIVKETTFEFLPLHAVAEINPIPPETKVVPPSGGLNTKTSTVPCCAMSVAVTVATNRRLLVNVVTRNELFQLTTESRRKSLPFGRLLSTIRLQPFHGLNSRY